MIRQGETSEEVEELQLALMSLGFDLPNYGADSNYGNETGAAINAYQRSKGYSETHGYIEDQLYYEILDLEPEVAQVRSAATGTPSTQGFSNISIFDRVKDSVRQNQKKIIVGAVLLGGAYVYFNKDLRKKIGF